MDTLEGLMQDQAVRRANEQGPDLTAAERVEQAARRLQERQRTISEARARFVQLPAADQQSAQQGFADAERAALAIVRHE